MLLKTSPLTSGDRNSIPDSALAAILVPTVIGSTLLFTVCCFFCFHHHCRHFIECREGEILDEAKIERQFPHHYLRHHPYNRHNNHCREEECCKEGHYVKKPKCEECEEERKEKTKNSHLVTVRNRHFNALLAGEWAYKAMTAARRFFRCSSCRSYGAFLGCHNRRSQPAWV